MFIKEIDGIIDLPARFNRASEDLRVQVNTDDAVVKGKIHPCYISIYAYSTTHVETLKCPIFIFPDTLQCISLYKLVLKEPLVYSPQLEVLCLHNIEYHAKLYIKAPRIELKVSQCPTLEYEIEFNSSLYVLSLVNSPLTSTTPCNIPPTIYLLTYIVDEKIEIKISQIQPSLVGYDTNRFLIDDDALIRQKYTHLPGPYGMSYYTQVTPSAIYRFSMHVLLDCERGKNYSLRPCGDVVLRNAISKLYKYLNNKNATTRAPIRKHLAQLNLALLCRHSRLPNDLKRYLFSFLN